jgi:5-methylcytosine-specific restriction endonuclease McrA
MNIYDDTPETEPHAKSTLPTKSATARVMRSSTAYQKARELFLYRAKAHHNPDGTKGEMCWLCGEPISYDLRFPHARSWSLDHAIPVRDEPSLALNPGNFRSAHLDCNNHRQTDAPPIDIGEPSEIW